MRELLPRISIWATLQPNGGKMAYDEKTAERVRALLSDRRDVVEKKLMGGLCFMVGGSMCCPPTWSRCSNIALDSFAMEAISDRLISLPAAFIRAVMAATEVDRTGSMTEFISGGAPWPDSL